MSTERPVSPDDRPAVGIDVPQDVPLPGGTQDAGRPVGERDKESPVPSSPRDVPSKLSRLATWRASRRRSVERDLAAVQASRAARDTERARVLAEQNAAARDAVQRRTAGQRRVTGRPRTDEEIAPVPNTLLWFGVWVNRTFGALPLIAPLGASAYMTMQAFSSAPLSLPWGMALVFSLALEGGVWRGLQIYVKTLLRGDSTISIRLGLTGYLLLIAGIIFAHSYVTAVPDAGKDLLDGQVHDLGTLGWLSAAGPPAAAAVMAFLGVWLKAKDARLRHRDDLKAQGKVDAQAVKFSPLAWVLTPIETAQALRHATRFRIETPLEAILDLRLYKLARRPKNWVYVPPGLDLLENADHGTGRDGYVPPAGVGRDAVAGHRGSTGRAGAGRSNGTVSGPGHRDAGHPAAETERPTGRFWTQAEIQALDSYDDGSTGHPVPLTWDVPQGGAGHGTSREQVSPAVHGGTRNGTHVTASVHGAGTPDVPNPDGTQRDTVPSEVLDEADFIIAPYLEHVKVVTAAFHDWRTKMPAVRKIIEAIHEHRLKLLEADQNAGLNPNPRDKKYRFNSNEVAGLVQQALRKVAGLPGIEDKIEAMHRTPVGL